MNEIYTSPRTGLQYALVRDGYALSVVGCTNRDIEHLKLPTRAIFSDGNIYPVVSISDGAFKGMEHLKYVDVPKSIVYIGEGAFRDCHALKRVWTNSSKRNLITLGGSAFRNCKKLEYVYGYFFFEPVDYTDSAFRGCESLYSVDYIKVYDGPEGYGCGIPDCIFKGCKSLNHVTIDGPVHPGQRRPKNLKYGWGEVGYSAFEGCANLERIGGSFKMQTIGTDAFKGCDRLTTKPAGLTRPTNGPDFDIFDYKTGRYKDEYLDSVVANLDDIDESELSLEK